MRIQEDIDELHDDDADEAWNEFSEDPGANVHSAFDQFFDYETLRQNMGDERGLPAATFDAHKRQPMPVSVTTYKNKRYDKL
jgi:hypothetical protein